MASRTIGAKIAAGVSRLVRSTLAFSKKLENHIGAIGLSCIPKGSRNTLHIADGDEEVG